MKLAAVDLQMRCTWIWRLSSEQRFSLFYAWSCVYAHAPLYRVLQVYQGLC